MVAPAGDTDALRHERGQVVVEFAFIVILLLLMDIGVIEFGRVPRLSGDQPRGAGRSALRNGYVG
jgi:hypothetical protein